MHNDRTWRVRFARAFSTQTMSATVCFTLLALIVTGPALIGRDGLAPDHILDADPLYQTNPAAPIVLVFDNTPTVLDLPRDLRFAQALHAGRLDMWNPLSGCGAPLWAEQGGPFFPLRLAFYLLPLRQTYYLFLALRLIFAGLGAYLLARQRGLLHVPGVAAGATFELCGALVKHLPYAAGSALYVLPWVILGSYVVAKKRSAISVVGAGIALGAVASSGHPTLILMVFAAYGIAIVGHILGAWRSPSVMLSVGLCGGVAALLGAALAAPSLLPFAELWEVSTSYKTRTIGLEAWERDLSYSRSVLPTALYASAALLTPNVSKDADVLSSTIGILTLVTAFAGILRRRLDPALLGVAVLGITLATAPAPLSWIYDFPRLGVRLIMPLYAWPLIALAFTQAAGDGVHIVSRPGGWRIGVPALLLYLAAALGILIGTNTTDGPVGHLKEALVGRASIMGLVAPPMLAAFAFAACFALQRTAWASWTAAGLTGLMIIEELTIILPFVRQPVSQALSASPSAAVRFLQSQLGSSDGRMVALPFRVGFPLSPMLFDLADMRGVSAMPVRRYYSYLHAISAKAGEFTLQDVPVVRSPLLDLAAVRFVVLPTESFLASDRVKRILYNPAARPEPNDSTMPVVYQDERITVYENLAAVPRVRIVHSVEPLPDEAAAARWAVAVGRHAEHARDLGLVDTVVLEPDAFGQGPPTLPARSGADNDTRPTGESVRITDQTDPDSLVIAAYLHEPGFVVVADTYYPAWRAWVDGSPTPIYPADLLFRAVPVPAGQHTIVMHYEPRAFRAGVVIFAVASVLCALIIIRARPRALG